MMTQYGGVTSQDVVRDTIGSPGHPSYQALAGMAIGHIDTIIGRLRAEVEDVPPVKTTHLYRLTSPLYWLQRLWALVRWVLGTARGRIVGAVTALALAIVGGVASGAPGAVVDNLLAM